jgi:phosphohistidine phosphatase
MKLYVMRHGPAEDQSASGVDGERALTAAGRERVRAVARRLVEEGEEPSQVVTSPLVRAVQTAEIVALGTKLGERGGTITVARELAPGGSAVAFARRLAAAGVKRILFVGHEPDLSNLVAGLLGTFDTPFEKATVVGLHLPGGDATPRLRFVLEGKSLRLDPDVRGGA